jgi:hypothetical protein
MYRQEDPFSSVCTDGQVLCECLSRDKRISRTADCSSAMFIDAAARLNRRNLSGRLPFSLFDCLVFYFPPTTSLFLATHASLPPPIPCIIFPLFISLSITSGRVPMSESEKNSELTTCIYNFPIQLIRAPVLICASRCKMGQWPLLNFSLPFTRCA